MTTQTTTAGTPVATITEAELFAEFRKSEIPKFNTRGKVIHLHSVEMLLSWPVEIRELDSHIDENEPDISGQLDAMREDIQVALDHLDLIIEAFEELKDERRIDSDDEDDDGEYVERYSPPKIDSDVPHGRNLYRLTKEQAAAVLGRFLAGNESLDRFAIRVVGKPSLDKPIDEPHEPWPRSGVEVSRTPDGEFERFDGHLEDRGDVTLFSGPDGGWLFADDVGFIES